MKRAETPVSRSAPLKQSPMDCEYTCCSLENHDLTSSGVIRYVKEAANEYFATGCMVRSSKVS